MKKLQLLSLIIFVPVFSVAQAFTDLNWGLRGFTGANVAFADYDNDGDQDFVMSGFGSTTAEWSGFYRIDNSIPVLIDSSLIKVSNGSSNWGDYDHDGDLDLLMNGQTNGGAQTALYRNDGTSLLTPVPNNGLPGFIGCMRWIDYDHDQLLDVIASGMIDVNFMDTTMLFHNDGNGTFSHAASFPFSFFEVDIQVMDYDTDSFPDFFITGRGSFSPNGFCGLFHNDGNGQFTQAPDNFRRLFTGTAKWGDYDNDGDPDILVDGIDSTNAVFTLIYENNSGSFTELPNVLPGSGEPGAVDWADIDNDGDFDIAISGSHLMRNDGNNLFANISPWDTMNFALPITFVDFDEDGDQDIFFLSYFGFTGTTMYQNNLFTGIKKDPRTENLLLYPNPANTSISIQSDLALNASFTVFDTQGRVVKKSNLNASENSIDISGFETGVYFIEIKNQDSIRKLRFTKM